MKTLPSPCNTASWSTVPLVPYPGPVGQNCVAIFPVHRLRDRCPSLLAGSSPVRPVYGFLWAIPHCLSAAPTTHTAFFSCTELCTGGIVARSRQATSSFIVLVASASPAAHLLTSAMADGGDSAGAQALKLEGNELFRAGMWYRCYARGMQSSHLCGALAGDFEGAVGKYSEAVTLDPDNATYRFNRGMARCKVGSEEQSAEALKDFHDAVRLKPDYGKAHARLAMLLLDSGRFADAEAAATAALDVDPSLEAAAKAKDTIEKVKGHAASALSMIGEGAPVHEPLGVGWVLSATELNATACDAAAAELALALTAAPGNTYLALARAYALFGARRYESAKQQALVAGIHTESTKLAAMADIALGKLDEAVAALATLDGVATSASRALDVATIQQVSELKQSGNANYKAKEYGAAVADYSKAVEVSKTLVSTGVPVLYNNLAAAYLQAAQ